MAEYTVEIFSMESDYYGSLSPADILHHSLNYMLKDMELDGCGRDVIYPALGAVWMIARMRFYQYSFIKHGDILTFKTNPRVIEYGKYIYRLQAFRGEEKVLDFDTAFMPVHFERRKILHLSLLRPYWKTPPKVAESRGLARLRFKCDFTDCGTDTVRMSDCDCNHHLTSPAYLNFACNALDYWGSDEPRLMKMMQVDYISEVLAGTQLRFQRGQCDGAHIMRGVKPDGKVAFEAKCVF